MQGQHHHPHEFYLQNAFILKIHIAQPVYIYMLKSIRKKKQPMNDLISKHSVSEQCKSMLPLKYSAAFLQYCSQIHTQVKLTTGPRLYIQYT